MSFVSDVVGGTIEGHANRMERLTDQDIKTQALAMEREKLNWLIDEHKRKRDEEQRNNTPIPLDNIWSAMKLTRNQKMVAEQFATMIGRVDLNTKTIRQGDATLVGEELMKQPVVLKELFRVGIDDSNKDLAIARDKAQAYINKKYPKGYTIETLMNSGEMEKNQELAGLIGEVINYRDLSQFHTNMYHSFAEKEATKAEDDLDERKKIDDLIKTQILTEYGTVGVKWDPYTESFVYPEGVDQKKILNRFNEIKKKYYKRYRIESIEDVPQEDIKKEKKIMRTGMHKGKKVIQYEDGSIEYAD